MGLLEKIHKLTEDFQNKRKERYSWQSRYEKLKNTENNKKARINFKKTIEKQFSNQELSEQQEAILFSQEFHRFFLKNPAGAKLPTFDEYEVEKTEATYIIKGFCDATNAYGAQVREAHEYEVYKNNGEWTCITDVGANALKWILICALVIALPSIITYCSIASM